MNDDDATFAPEEPTEGDEHDDAVIAADDTGMLAGERFITQVVIEEGASSEGDV